MKGQFPLYWLDHTISKYREPITSSCIRKGLVRQYLHSTYSPRPSAGVKWWPWCLKSNSCSNDLKSPVSCQEETLIEVLFFNKVESTVFPQNHLKHFLSSNHQSLNTLLMIPCLCHKTGHSATTQLSLVLQALQSLLISPCRKLNEIWMLSFYFFLKIVSTWQQMITYAITTALQGTSKEHRESPQLNRHLGSV